MQSRSGHRLRHLIVVAGLTVAVVAALGFGFQIKPADPANSNAGVGVGQDVQRITLPNDRRKVPPELHPLLDYMSVMDPTIMTHPTDINPRLHNLDVGLYARSGEFRRERQDLPPARSNQPSVPPPTLPPRPVASPIEAPLEAVAAATRQTIPEPTEPVSTIRRPEARVYWVDENGRELEFFPRLAANALESINLVAYNPTTLEVLPPEKLEGKPDVLPVGDQLPRVRLVRSSGNAALDRVAYQHLRHHVIQQVAAVNNPQRDAWLTTPRSITVHWEYVPDISYRPDWPRKMETDDSLEPPWYDLNQH